MKPSDIILVKVMTNRGAALLPYGQRDKAKLDKVKLGEPHNFQLKRNRNLDHHQKLFAILAMVIVNSDDPDYFQVAESIAISRLLIKLKFGIGYCDQVNINGELREYPKSISFPEMPQAEFEEFYRAAILWLSEYSGISVEEMDANYHDYL